MGFFKRMLGMDKGSKKTKEELEAEQQAEAERFAAEEAQEAEQLQAEQEVQAEAQREALAELERLKAEEAAAKAEAERLEAAAEKARQAAAQQAETARQAAEEAESLKKQESVVEQLEVAEPSVPEPEPVKEPETPIAATQEEAPAKKGWIGRLRSGLSKSTGKMSGGISQIFTHRRLDEEALDDLEDLLIMSDLGVETAGDMRELFRRSNKFGKEVSPEEIKASLADTIAGCLTQVTKPLEINSKHKPHVVLMVGVNGSGKTTTIGKLAQKFSAEGKSVMLAAGDTFRAAAIEQLEIWGKRTNTPVISGKQGADAAGLAFDALQQAQAKGADVLLIDTAGRLQNKTDLMAELEKIVRVIKKKDPNAPHDTVLVLDGTTGQNAISQVRTFKELVNISGLVVTKLDGSAKGGVVVGLADQFALPIHAIGVGESADDLQPFEAKSFARMLVGVE